MRHSAWLIPALVLTGGCGLGGPTAGAKVVSIDPSVDQATADRLGGQLLQKLPGLKAERAKLQRGGMAVDLILRVEHGPEPEYTGTDKELHRNHYWMYAGLHGRDRIQKTYRVLIHKQTGEILVYDEALDRFTAIP